MGPAPAPATEAGEVAGSVGSSACSGYGRWFIIIQICNTIVIGGLIAVVVFLFGQIELLNYRISQDEEAVEELKIQVQEKQEGQIQQLNEAVQEEHNLTLNTLAGTLTLLTCLISMFHMTSHLRSYNEPTVQRKIVAILWMSPIYSCTSLFSLLVPPVEGYLAIIKDFYESYCIYTFLSFLIAVLGRGDRSLVVDVLSKHADHLHRPTRWLSYWYNPAPDTSDQAKANAVITECQILCLQFVFVRPLTSIARFVAETLEHAEANDLSLDGNSTLSPFANDTIVDSYLSGEDNHYADQATMTPYDNSTYDKLGDENSTTAFLGSYVDDQQLQDATKAYFTSPPFFIAMVTNVSVFFAFAGLLKFYHAVRDDLKFCKPFPKFLTIKGVVFVTFWQGLVISICLNLKQEELNDNGIDPSERASQLQNVLICLEMLFFSITHWCVFPAEEWEQGFKPKIVATPGIGIQDFVSDVSHIVRSRRKVVGGPLAAVGLKGDSRGSYHDAEAAITAACPSDEEPAAITGFDDSTEEFEDLSTIGTASTSSSSPSHRKVV